MNQAITTEYKHILLGDRLSGSPTVFERTPIKVVELITSVQAYGWSPEELHFQYPHISMSKIYSALAYYWNNKENF